MDLGPLEGLTAATYAGAALVFVGIAIGVISLAAVAVEIWTATAAIKRDQAISAARLGVAFAAVIVFAGALLLLATPAIQTMDPARQPTPSPTASESSSA